MREPISNMDLSCIKFCSTKYKNFFLKFREIKSTIFAAKIALDKDFSQIQPSITLVKLYLSNVSYNSKKFCKQEINLMKLYFAIILSRIIFSFFI